MSATGASSHVLVEIWRVYPKFGQRNYDRRVINSRRSPPLVILQIGRRFYPKVSIQQSIKDSENDLNNWTKLYARASLSSRSPKLMQIGSVKIVVVFFSLWIDEAHTLPLLPPLRGLRKSSSALRAARVFTPSDSSFLSRGIAAQVSD